MELKLCLNYCWKLGSLFENVRLSIIWNNSWGAGIRPVCNFDQTGTSFSDISNAPDDIS